MARSVEKRSRSSLQQLIGRSVFGGALVMSCLQAGAASALSFNFTFTGNGSPTSPATVTGVVDGLVDNLNDQKTGLTVTVTSATNSGLLPDVFTDADYLLGDGFDVSGGQVTGVSIEYFTASWMIHLGNQSFGNPNYSSTNSPVYNSDSSSGPNNSLAFTPITPQAPASAPGPLPLFGAAAAFGWSRQLRRRIKRSA